MTVSELENLVALQEHDTAIEQLRRRLAALPERAGAHDLNERRRGAEATIAALQTELDALAAEEEEVERSLTVIETRAATLDATLRSPGSATRDAQAIIHEIDQLREQAGALEESGLALLERRDALAADQARARAVLEEVAAQAPEVLAKVAVAEAETAAELQAAENERDAIAAGIDDALLATYEKLRGRSDGVAVARVVNNTCSGCHLSLSAQDVDRLHKLQPGQHTSCEQCGRILIP